MSGGCTSTIAVYTSPRFTIRKSVAEWEMTDNSYNCKSYFATWREAMDAVRAAHGLGFQTTWTYPQTTWSAYSNS